MTVCFYMDEHVARAVTIGLRRRGVDVLTVQADNHSASSDIAIMDRALQLGRVVFTQDDDFLVAATDRQRTGAHFAGVVYCHQMRLTIGQIVADLHLLGEATEPDELVNAVVFLPL